MSDNQKRIEIYDTTLRDGTQALGVSLSMRDKLDITEALDAFGKRVAEALEELLSDCAGEHVLVVAHAGVIRAALGHVLQADPQAWYRVRVDNAALTRFRRGPYGNKLEFHNRPSLG